MAEIKCPCGLRNHMEEEDCKKTNCNACCPLTKPQTNADRIRAMSDEELAKFIDGCYAKYSCDYCPNGKNVTLRELCNGERCKPKNGMILDWLKQPVQEGE